jgi:hypothetical protein
MKTGITLDTVVVAAPDHLASAVGEEVVVLGLNTGVYYGLNRSGARLWQKLQAPVKVGALHAALVAAYEVDPDTARQDLLRLLEELRAADLIAVCPGAP